MYMYILICGATQHSYVLKAFCKIFLYCTLYRTIINFFQLNIVRRAYFYIIYNNVHVHNVHGLNK